MSYKHPFIVVAISMMVTATALAATPPSNVSQVQVGMQNSKVTVTWSAATDPAGIAFYRVYFSRKSIMDNQGDYDDFERTKAAETSYTFNPVPYKDGMLYAAVLAVNKDGVESEGFETEASVNISNPASSVASVASSPAAQAPVSIAKSLVPSATSIVLTFSAPLAESSVLTDSFVIVDDAGNTLGITDVAVSGAEVTITTATQQPGKVYVLGVLNEFFAANAAIVGRNTPQVTFSGFNAPAGASSSTASSVSSDASSSSGFPQYVRNPALDVPVENIPPPKKDPGAMPKKDLPGSGPGAAIALAAAGLVAGRRVLRRSKKG